MTRFGANGSRDANQPGHDAPLLTLRDAGVRRGGRQLWSGVDLDVRPGDFVAVLGPNGVGKSTMLGVLLGQHHPDQGEVRVLGSTPGSAKARVGYLPQRRSFEENLRIRGRDVVRLGLDGSRWGFPLPGARRFSAAARAAADRVDEVLELVGATEYADRPVGRCSGGEQQRLLIAQALAPRPELLLLDEPLDSLDLPNQASIAALVSRVCREQRVAVMIVAHDVNPILSHLDTVVYLARQGCRVGPPRLVITSESLTRLFGTPIEVLTASDGRMVVVGQPDERVRHMSAASTG